MDCCKKIIMNQFQLHILEIILMFVGFFKSFATKGSQKWRIRPQWKRPITVNQLRMTLIHYLSSLRSYIKRQIMVLIVLDKSLFERKWKFFKS